jgi:integrase
MALLAYMRRLKLGYVPHGFRSSFRDFASERTTASRDVAEVALAHLVTNKVEAAYRRSTLLELRRKLMEPWATFCAGGGAVVKLVSAR